jgi:hypothetical protein
MASTFVSGTGSLKSTTLPAAFVEACLLLRSAEMDATIQDANRPENVTMSFNPVTKRAVIELSLPIVTGYDGTTGNITVQASDYIAAAGGTSTYSDSGSELVGTSIPSAVWQLAQKLSQAEQNSLATEKPDNIQIAVNFETGRASIEGSFAFIYSISSAAGHVGATLIDVVDYL